jgi:hypothetical protein
MADVVIIAHPVGAPRVPDEPVLPAGLLVDAVADDGDVVLDLGRVGRVVEHAAGVVLDEGAAKRKTSELQRIKQFSDYVKKVFSSA